jgi:hypothetical protein
VDEKPQIVAHAQRSYFKISAKLNDEYTNTVFPDNTLLFTMDAVSYYTNTPTEKALSNIAAYLRANIDRFHCLPAEALISDLNITMTNNIFTFGDTTWTQNDGTAMGTPPAPSYVTTYYAIHEEEILAEFHKKMWHYRRFIDDVGGGWTITNPATDLATWTRFKECFNDPEFEIQ